MNTKRTNQVVRDLLEKDSNLKNPKLINSDRLLQLAVWRREGLHLTKEQEQIFRHCTSAEYIARTRRHLQAEFPVTNEVVLERRARQTTTAIAFKGSRKATVLEKLEVIGLKGRGKDILAVVRKRTNAANTLN